MKPFDKVLERFLTNIFKVDVHNVQGACRPFHDKEDGETVKMSVFEDCVQTRNGVLLFTVEEDVMCCGVQTLKLIRGDLKTAESRLKLLHVRLCRDDFCTHETFRSIPS